MYYVRAHIYIIFLLLIVSKTSGKDISKTNSFANRFTNQSVCSLWDGHLMVFHCVVSPQRAGFLAPSSGSPLCAGPGRRTDPLRGGLPSVALATHPALRPPAGDLGVLRPGRLLFVRPTVRLPSDTGSDRKKQTSLTMLLWAKISSLR